MNRREFVKLLAVAVSVPSLADLPKEQEFPVKWRYRGFDIVVDIRHGKCDCKQLAASNGKHIIGVLFEEPLDEFWDRYKPYLDKAIDRNKAWVSGKLKRMPLSYTKVSA
jgi:hypothetical protein